MTEAEVRKSGRPVLVGKRPMTRVGRAVEKGETQGFMKVVVDAETKQILGAAILGVGGDEVIHSILDVMYAKAPYTVIQRAMHIHPTVSELVPTMLGELRPSRRGIRLSGRLTAQNARAIAIASSSSAIGRSLPADRLRQARAELVAAERSRDRAERAEDQARHEALPGRRADRRPAERSHQDPRDELRRRLAAAGLRQLVVDELAERERR